MGYISLGCGENCDFTEGGFPSLCDKDHCSRFKPWGLAFVHANGGFKTLSEFNNYYGTNFSSKDVYDSDSPKQKLQNEKNVLKVNIDRMFATDNKKELLQIYNDARKRLEKIYLCNCDWLDKQELSAVKEDKPKQDPYVQQRLF